MVNASFIWITGDFFFMRIILICCRDITAPYLLRLFSQMDRLITYFDIFYADLSNGVFYNDKEFDTDKFKVRAKQMRLKHKPFSYTVTVESDKKTPSIILTYLAPKTDGHGRKLTYGEIKSKLMLLDMFVRTLTPGKNELKRECCKNMFTCQDRTSFVDIYKKTMGVLTAKGEMSMDGSEIFWGIPER